MFRVDSANSVAALPAVGTPGTPGYFSDGVPGTTQGTTVPAWWLNGVQEEISNAITGGGLTLAKTDFTQLAQVLDAIRNLARIPSGVMTEYAGSTAPSGWLLCNGAAVSRITYATLYSVIGTNFGIGDGTTTFNLPDRRGRVGVGAGTGTSLTARSLGQIGGEEAHTMTLAELAQHNHDNGIFNKLAKTDGSQSATNVDYDPTGNELALLQGGQIQPAGNNTPFNVMQPFLVVNFIIKT